jgi:lysophospholipase L1-like esterase
MPAPQALHIINAGVGGNNTRALLARVETDVLAHRPSLVVVMVGTSDALNSAALVPPAEFRAALAALALRLTQAGSRVLLATVVPFHLPALLTRHRLESYGDLPPAARHARINEIIREVARGCALPLAEVNTVFTQRGNIGEDPGCLLRNLANSGVADGVHPTAAGYRLIAEVMHQAIREHRLPTATIVCFGDSITFGAAMPGAGTANGSTYPARLAELFAREPAAATTCRDDP